MLFEWLIKLLFEADDTGGAPEIHAAPITTDIAPGYERWPGARPEVAGLPVDTILAVKGLDRWSEADRRAVLDAAMQLGAPVDSLVSVWSSESGLSPKAAFGVRHTTEGEIIRDSAGRPANDKTNQDRIAAGKAPFYAVGILQLTTAANLDGFTTNDALLEVLNWTPKEQIERIAIPLYRKMNVQGVTPGKLYMLNFLPEHAGKPPDFILGDKNAGGRSASIYTMNKGFDTQGKGVITVDDVYRAVGRVVKAAGFRRMTPDGRLLVPAGAAGAPAAAVAARVAPTAAPAPAASPTAAPAPAAPVPGKAGGRLMSAVRAGAIEPPTWAEVPFAGATVLAAEDALRATVDGTSLRLPVSWAETLTICRLLDCVPLTAELETAIWQAAPVKVDPRPLGKWDTPAEQKASSEAMMSLDWCRRFNKDLDAQVAGRSGIVSPTGKSWIFSRRLLLRPSLGVTFGWFWRDGRPIQALGDDKTIPAHNDSHYDYSQLFRAVKRWTKEGKDVLDLYRSKGLDEGVIRLFTLR